VVCVADSSESIAAEGSHRRWRCPHRRIEEPADPGGAGRSHFPPVRSAVQYCPSTRGPLTLQTTADPCQCLPLAPKLLDQAVLDPALMPGPTVIGHPQGERGQQRRAASSSVAMGRVQPSHGCGQHRRDQRDRGEGNPWQLTLPLVENIEAPDLQPAPSASFLSSGSERRDLPTRPTRVISSATSALRRLRVLPLAASMAPDERQPPFVPLARHSTCRLCQNYGSESWVGDPAANHLSRVWESAGGSISAGSVNSARRYPVKITPRRRWSWSAGQPSRGVKDQFGLNLPVLKEGGKICNRRFSPVAPVP
jgi:hypothetical protein